MAKKRVNKYPIAFRQMAVERMKNCANVSALAEELGVDRTVLYHWQEAGRRAGWQRPTPPSESFGKRFAI